MATMSFNPLVTLAIGFLAGIGTLVFLVGRLDRSDGSGCFYTILQALVIVIAVAILAAASGG